MPPPGTSCTAPGKKIEVLAAYEPCFRFMAEWWKQLYGECEGKERKGLFPASVEFTADLHSMGQYIQQGERSAVRDGGALRRFPPAAWWCRWMRPTATA